MKYLNFKYNDVTMKISKIVLGTGRFGTKLSEEASFELLDAYVENGGNLIDTARSYSEWLPGGRGSSERTIGKWLKNTGNRNKVYISTKGGMNRIDGKLVIDIKCDTLDRELKESLEALNTEYVDLYLLHRDDTEEPVEAVMETLNSFVESGRVRAIGVSNWSLDRIRQANAFALKNKIMPITVAQLWWCLAEYTDNMWNDPTTTHMDDSFYKYFLENNIPVMAYTSQAKGFFSKAMKVGIENLDDFLKLRILTDTNRLKFEAVKAICEDEKCDPVAIVLGYITSNPLQGMAIIGCSTMDQLLTAMNNADFELEQSLIDVLDSITANQ